MNEFLIADHIYYDPEDNSLNFCENTDDVLNPHIIPIVTELTKRDIEVIKQVIRELEEDLAYV